MIARLRRELGLTDVRTPPSPDLNPPSSNGAVNVKINVSELVTPGGFFGMTQVQAVRAFLDRARQPASLRDIAQALYRGKVTDHLIEGAAALRNLSSVLSRAREFVSVAHGYWGLVEWYPDRAVRRVRASREDQGSGGTEPEGGDAGRSAEPRGAVGALGRILGAVRAEMDEQFRQQGARHDRRE